MLQRIKTSYKLQYFKEVSSNPNIWEFSHYLKPIGYKCFMPLEQVEVTLPKAGLYATL